MSVIRRQDPRVGVLLAAFALCGCDACGSGQDATAPPITVEDDFRFEARTIDPESSDATVTWLWRDGLVDHWFHAGGTRHARFEVPSTEVDALARLLDEAAFLSLPPASRRTRPSEGELTMLSLRNGAADHAVWRTESNADDLAPVQTHIVRLVESNATALQAAALIHPAEVPVSNEVEGTLPVAPAPLSMADDFRFEVRGFNWELMGSNVTVVSADRSLTQWTHRAVAEPATPEVRAATGAETVTGVRFYRAEAALTEDELAGFVRVLGDEGFTNLEQSYDGDLADGAVVDFRLRNGGQTHEVHCSNLFPPEIGAIQAGVEALRVAHLDELGDPEEISREAAEAAGAAN